EFVRWWYQWLKRIDTGMKDDPKISTWIQESENPQVNYEERPGKWVVDHASPSANVAEKQFWLHDTKLVEAANVEETITVSGVQEHGLYAGVYCPFGEPGDLPSDQRLENGKSVLFTTDAFREPVDLLENQPLIWHLRVMKKMHLLQ